MPERVNAVSVMVEETLGVQAYHGGTGRCQTMPTSEVRRQKIAMDKLYVRVVETINFNRIVLMAASRHIQLHDGDSQDEVCGECLREAMLALDPYAAHWAEGHERSPRERPELEAALAEALEDEAETPWSRYMDFPQIAQKESS